MIERRASETTPRHAAVAHISRRSLVVAGPRRNLNCESANARRAQVLNKTVTSGVARGWILDYVKTQRFRVGCKANQRIANTGMRNASRGSDVSVSRVALIAS